MKYFWFSAVLALTGCGTIINGTTQQIAVDTNPQKPSICQLSNEKGTWRVTTPGNVVVSRSEKDLSVICQTNDGYQGAANFTPAGSDGMAFATGFLTGGVGGIVSQRLY